MSDENTNSVGSYIKEVIKFVVIAAIIVIPIRAYVAQPFIVDGWSMFPTFKNGQYLIVDEISYNLGGPSRGDVIVFKYPKDTSKYFIKRVIGLPGETLTIKNGVVTIKNDEHPKGVTLDEKYILNDSSEEFKTTLGPKEYFVMGDNRVASSDSRFWGPVPQKLIVGRVLVRLFPFRSASVHPGIPNSGLYPQLPDHQ